ncbi:MAG TPA: Fic family protein [Candidatus Elarobacter sp.]|nr:Fic family protein [Candidatus Elarobacter sp.]
MQYLTEDDVIAFYTEAIGTPVLRYPEGLASAVGRPQQTAFGEDAYPTLMLKAAALMQSLAQNQPFIDGNKRIAWIAGKVFLQIHGFTMHATDAEALDLFVNRIAAGMNAEDLAAWIGRHIAPLAANEQS